MNKKCFTCSNQFSITEEDLEFYKKMSVPAPTHCPDCRAQRRMSFRNERSFHKRTCDNCNKTIVSIYSKDVKWPVYCNNCWWSDSWDAMRHGQVIDFNRPFFEQFKELFDKIPQLFMVNAFGVKDEYSNYGYRNKNCYLLIASDDNEDCHYGNYLWNSKDCIDNLYLQDCQLCYECIDTVNSYNCNYCQNIENCNDCYFCWDLKGCHDCFACVGLRHKQYCFMNQQLTKDEYTKRVKELVHSLTEEVVNEYLKKIEEVKFKIPHKYADLVNCENSTGDHLKNSKNAQECYDSYGLEDCKFITNGPGKVKDCYDFCGAKDIELSYEGVSTGGPGFFARFNNHVWNGCKNVTYCTFCVASQNLFGCVGLKRQKYCILNKQYSKADYENLEAKLIKHMEVTGEWGEFFPMKISPFDYKETLAQVYFPR